MKNNLIYKYKIMANWLSKKDFKIIWKSIKNPEKVIIELDQRTLDGLVWTKKRVTKNKLVNSWVNDKDEWVLKSKNEINNFLMSL